MQHNVFCMMYQCICWSKGLKYYYKALKLTLLAEFLWLEILKVNTVPEYRVLVQQELFLS